ncbi:MAG: hypothetical protein UDM12_04150, partial [Prevotellamassilia sp.]|nr:hypothetical protein [Prevotellamassilia sp.]
MTNQRPSSAARKRRATAARKKAARKKATAARKNASLNVAIKNNGQPLSRCSKLFYSIQAGISQFNIALPHSFAPTTVF